MKRNKADDITGWLIIDKPRNMGSTQVVGKTRYLLHANKNGHTGTLDPFATGILPIAFGEATKLVPFVMDGRKEYEFIVKWGEQTQTDDTEGEIIAKKNKRAYTESIRYRRPTKKWLFHWSVCHAHLCKFLSNTLIIYGELIDFLQIL